MLNAYSVAASLMRYVFLAVLVYFIITLIVRSVSEARYLRAAQRILNLSIRWIEVLAPMHYRGKWFLLNEDTVIGSSTDCEISLPQSELKQKHARIMLKRGEYRFSTKKKRYCEINGQPLIRRETPLADGDMVWIQDVCFVCHKHRAREESENG